MTAQRHWLILASALVVGIAGGAAWPPPPLPKIKQGDVPWNLPTTKDLLRHVPQDMEAVTRGMRWKGGPGGPSNESSWRLVGIVNKGGPVILVMPADKPNEVKRIAIGEALPDGSLLESVNGDQATTRRDSCLMTYQPYLPEAVEKSAGCDESAAPAQGTDQ